MTPMLWCQYHQTEECPPGCSYLQMFAVADEELEMDCA